MYDLIKLKSLPTKSQIYYVIARAHTVLILSLVLFLLPKQLKSQHAIIETDKTNPIFNCRYEIYTLVIDRNNKNMKPPHSVIIDTFNICRIRKQGIKELFIYHSKMANDSFLWREIYYSPDGFIKKINPEIGWFSYAAINPDTIFLDCSKQPDIAKKTTSHEPKKTIKTRYSQEQYIFDSLGYLVKHTKTERGIINRWITRTVGSIPVKWVTTYHYSRDYKSVTVNRYAFRNKNNNHYIHAERIFCEFDHFGNILSEKHFLINTSGEPVFEQAFSYDYKYFKK